MDVVYNLKSGVSLSSLYNGLTSTQKAKLERLSKNGFTEDELQQLEDAGIDTSKIKKNSTTKTTNTTKKEKTSSDVSSKASEIKKKYCSDLEKYDKDEDQFDAKNPQLQAFKKALNDNLVNNLVDSGFTKKQVIDIVHKAFPTIGIENKSDGKYSLPKGHGDEAVAIYKKFSTTLVKATCQEAQDLKEAEAKLKSLNSQITSNNNSIKNLEYNITVTQSDIETKLKKAIAESKEIAQEQKEESEDIIAKRLNEYTSSNGEMSYDKFKSNVTSDLDSLAGSTNSQLASVVLNMLDAQREMTTLNTYLSSMKNLIATNKDLKTQADETEAEVSRLTKALDNMTTDSDAESEKTDPIGFVDSDIRYDFFVDRDSNGTISNKNEFLGAHQGFEELMAFDADKDERVTAAELDSNNVRVILSQSGKKQQIKSASEVFKSNDFINLRSYRSANQSLGDGNQLIGTFGLNIDNKEINTGYQTLDTTQWLNDNFEFSDGTAGYSDGMKAAETLDYDDKVNIFEMNNARLASKQLSTMSAVSLNQMSAKSNITNAKHSSKISQAAFVEQKFEQEAREAQKAELEEQEAQKQAQEEIELEKLKDDKQDKK